MKILKEIYQPSETTYSIAKYWPFWGGFGAAIIRFLPDPIWIIWLLFVLIASNIIIIRGAVTLPVDEERVSARKNNPPRFSIFYFSFFMLLPLLSIALLFFSYKFFAIALSVLSTISIIFFGTIDYSIKRVLLSSISLIAFSFFMIYQYSEKGIILYFIIIVFAIQKSIESCLENKKILNELKKDNEKISFR
ncbi:hypothetical protein [Pelobacter seleniigenes]|uniref:hypothetical protein n=1 Tax=Pelobacter seleniigenes TaxID=407188 RepID=UPI0004A6CF0A|nr:hypothetical protein [Pelobacter seleniigenes]